MSRHFYSIKNAPEREAIGRDGLTSEKPRQIGFHHEGQNQISTMIIFIIIIKITIPSGIIFHRISR